MPSKQVARKAKPPETKPRKKAARRDSEPQPTPVVKLGELEPRGVSASMFALVERGAIKRPRVARSLRGTVEIRFKEDFAPVRMEFSADEVLVEDGKRGRTNGRRADLVVSGSLPDIVQLASAPLMGGLPKPTNKRGRAALASWAGGRVKIEGSPLLARRLLKLLEI